MPAITSESWKLGSLMVEGIDCELQLKNGIEPCERMLFISLSGKL